MLSKIKSVLWPAPVATPTPVPAPPVPAPQPLVVSKSELDTSGGWAFLQGMLEGNKWKGADEIFNDLSESELERLHNNMVVVYACVKKICLAVTEAPLRMGREVNGIWEDDNDHWLNRILKRPNPRMSYSEFIWHYEAHKQLTGTTYVWKWRNGLRQPAELWPMPTSWVKPKYGDTGVAYYEVWQGGKWLPVPPEDMIRVIFPDPTNLSDGIGPLQAALREVQSEDERQRYIVEMMVNARTPGMTFYQPDEWGEPQKAEIRAAIMQGLGRGNRGKPLFMQGEGARIDHPTPLKDLDWPGLTALNETRICAAFGPSPILLGLRSGNDAATYSNYEHAKRSFYQDTMVPTWNQNDSGLTKGLLTDEGEPQSGLEVYHDTSNVRALRDDEDKIMERAVKGYQGGLLTLDRARELVGEEALPNDAGKVRLVPMSMIEQPITSAKPEAPPKDEGKPTADE